MVGGGGGRAVVSVTATVPISMKVAGAVLSAGGSTLSALLELAGSDSFVAVDSLSVMSPTSLGASSSLNIPFSGPLLPLNDLANIGTLGDKAASSTLLLVGVPSRLLVPAWPFANRSATGLDGKGTPAASTSASDAFRSISWILSRTLVLTRSKAGAAEIWGWVDAGMGCSKSGVDALDASAGWTGFDMTRR